MGEAGRLEADIELTEREGAFVKRFGWPKDAVGDKLLLQYLNAAG